MRRNIVWTSFRQQRDCSRRKAAMSFAGAVAAALVSVLGLHGWHIYIGLGLTLIAALYGLMRWSKKYPLQ
jgi:hypothetical protein